MNSTVPLPTTVPVVDVSQIELPCLSDLPWIDGVVPLPALVAALSALDPAVLPGDFDVLEIAAAWRAVASAATGAELLALAELASRPDVIGPDDDPAVVAARARRGPAGEVTRVGVGDEVSVRLADSPAVAASRCRLAVELPHRFPAMAAEIAVGHAGDLKARILLDGCRTLSDDVARAVDMRVAHLAARQTPSQFRQSVRRAVLREDPSTATERRQRAEGDRQVRIHPSGDGMAELWALLPAEAATRLGKALDTYARAARARGDERTLDQLRADGLTDQVSRSVEVQVVVPASVLLGMDDGPAELAGYGPIDGDLARTLATDATWRRILVDPDDRTVLSVGASTYRPGAVLARHVQVRDQQCWFPSCSVPADRCDLDHTIPFGTPGGLTVEGNLGPGCRRHHQLKHGPPVGRDLTPRLRQARPGWFSWTLPTGHAYVVPPPPLLEPEDPLLTAVGGAMRPVSLLEHGLTQYLSGHSAGRRAA